MKPLGVEGGSHETTREKAVTLTTVKFSGGVPGASPEPEPSREESQRRASSNREREKERKS